MAEVESLTCPDVTRVFTVRSPLPGLPAQTDQSCRSQTRSQSVSTSKGESAPDRVVGGGGGDWQWRIIEWVSGYHGDIDCTRSSLLYQKCVYVCVHPSLLGESFKGGTKLKCLV